MTNTPIKETSFLRGTLRALGAVATAMVGLRRSKDREKDFAILRTSHVLTAGSLIALILIVGLIALVKSIAP